MKTETFIQVKDDGTVANHGRLQAAFLLRKGNYKVTIEKCRSKRSLPLNAYYWGCVVDIQQQGFKDIGYDYSKEQIHEFNKGEFNYEEIVNHQTGEVKRIGKSTTGLTNTEFMEFLEKVKMFSSEWLQVFIPDPSSQRAINY